MNNKRKINFGVFIFESHKKIKFVQPLPHNMFNDMILVSYAFNICMTFEFINNLFILHNSIKVNDYNHCC